MPAPPKISLSKARKQLESPTTLISFVDQLEHLSPESIKALAPVVFDVVAMENDYLAAKALKAIIKHCPEWIEHKNEESNTPLMKAVENNAMDLVDMLLDAGAKTTHKNKEFHGVLDIAAYLDTNQRWQAAMGQALFEKSSFTQKDKDRALYSASDASNLGMTRVLLEQGARFGFKTEAGTALSAAVFNHYEDTPSTEIVKALLQTVEGMLIIDQGWDNREYGSPMHRAASSGNLPTLAVLIDAGAAINPPPSTRHLRPATPMMRAAKDLQPEAIELLIKSGADATLIDFRNQNALHYLASADSGLEQKIEDPLLLQAMDMLLAAGVDPTQENLKGQTPADKALGNDRLALFTALTAHASSRQLTQDTEQPIQKKPVQKPRI